jgi:O-antigen ligase
LKRWLEPIFLYFIALNFVKDKKMVKNTIVIIMFAVTIVSLMAIYDYVEKGAVSSLQKARVGGIAEQANMLGGFFVYYMFLFAGFLLVNYKSLKHWLLCLPFITCFGGIQVTFSRGAYLAFAFACLSLAFLRSKVLFLIAIFLVILALLNPVILPAGMRYRLASTFTNEQIYATSLPEVMDESAQQRLAIWKGGIRIIQDHPLFGVGYGVFPYIISMYAPVGQIDAHNTYIINGAEMGIFALLIFLLILILIMKHALRLYKKSTDKFIKSFALGFLSGVIGLLVVNMFGSRLDSSEVSSYFWILSALVFRAKLLEKIDLPITKR